MSDKKPTIRIGSNADIEGLNSSQVRAISCELRESIRAHRSWKTDYKTKGIPVILDRGDTKEGTLFIPLDELLVTTPDSLYFISQNTVDQFIAWYEKRRPKALQADAKDEKPKWQPLDVEHPIGESIPANFNPLLKKKLLVFAGQPVSVETFEIPIGKSGHSWGNLNIPVERVKFEPAEKGRGWEVSLDKKFHPDLDEQYRKLAQQAIDKGQVDRRVLRGTQGNWANPSIGRG